MPVNGLSNEAVLPELYFLIAHFLNNSPFKQTAQQLITQLEQYKVLPPRLDWTGNKHERTYSQLEAENFNQIPSNFLLQICNQLKSLIGNQLEIGPSSLNSLFGIGQFSILQDVQKLKKKQEQNLITQKTSNLDALPKNFFLNHHVPNKSHHLNNSRQCRTKGGINLILNLTKRQLNGGLSTSSLVQPELFRSVNIHKRILGHLSAVYCVCFDRTGRYILTGADDNLIKAWSAHDGRLLATFRGHEKEISDIDINFENTLLASGSCDKTIRIWNLKTTECDSVLQSHSAMVTSLEFSPYCRGTTRWLASSGNDGVICFWYWNSETLKFNAKPRRFIEKSRPGGQILCLSFSAGGLFMAAGSNDHAIRVYCFENNEPSKICELESHTNWVDSIQYANRSARFLSGSKDGTAKIWSFESQQWKNVLIDGTKTLQKSEQNEIVTQDILKRYSVTMVAWNCDDTLVITAQNNFIIKVWNSTDAQLIHELKGHNDEIFVLESHPSDPRLLLSSGHDGNVILWNLLSGKMIKKFYNRIENEGHGCLFDTKWSSTMDMFASTDSHGNLTIFGFGGDENFKKVPAQLFFHTDYRPLMRDTLGSVLDEQTQVPPHLMPPPFLVDADGNPYNSDLQRLVPGRENLTDAQLIPHIITNENGVSEIIGDRESEENQHLEQLNENQRNATRNTWLKCLIRPLESSKMRTNELERCQSLDQEESNYKKELKEIELSHQKGSVYIYRDGENSNTREPAICKRRRGKAKNNENTESQMVNQNTNMDFDEDTLDDQYIDIDDDSTRQSTDAMQATGSNSNSGLVGLAAGTSGTNRNVPTQSRRRVYIEPSELITESDITSEYSDWAEEDGRKTLRPPTRKTNRQRSNRRNRHKRVLRVQDDDEENNLDETGETDSFDLGRSSKSRAKTTLSKKIKKLISDDDDENDDQEIQAEKLFSDIKKENYDDTELNDEEMYEDESSGESEEEYNYDDDDDDDNDENDENMDPNRPCTSRAATTSSKSPKKTQITRKKHRKTKRGRPALNSKLSDQNLSKQQQQQKQLINNKTNLKLASSVLEKARLKECPVEYRPPEWLTSTKPRKTPYVPQIGDEVVYFRQGHELYVQAVKTLKTYEIDDNSLPWSNGADLGVQEFCKVINIKIEIKPPRLVCLKLGVTDRHTGKLTAVKFSISYHDMDGVADFVILKQFYEKAIERNWRPKDRFRSIIDDVWYLGVIESKKPFQDDYPDSQFQCLKVVWDNGDIEALSPWDLEPLSGINARKTKISSASILPCNGESISVTLEELRSMLYTPLSYEWPGEDRDVECERILSGLEKIMELSIAEAFNYPVDLDQFPDYAVVIRYPIDLNTIKERLENRYYRRLNAVQWDIMKIEEDAHDYNEPDSKIYQQSTLLTNLLTEFITDPDCTNPIPIYKRLCKDSALGENEDNNQSLNSTRRACRNRPKVDMNTTANNNNNNNSSIQQQNLRFNLRSRTNLEHQEASSKNDEALSSSPISLRSYSWRDDCKKLVSDIIKHPDSVPFRAEVDCSEYPDYIEKISNPVDFGLIRTRLFYNTYDRLEVFEKDCNRVFTNSKTYNTNKRSKIFIMTLRLLTYYNERITEIKHKYESSLIEKSKLKKSRRKPKHLANNSDLSTKKNQSEQLSKISSQSKNEYNQPTTSSNTIEASSTAPSTSGYITRSASNRKIKSINSNSNHQNPNENTENSLSQYDTQPGTLSLLNRSSYMDEDTQMALLDQNIEYDLNEDYQDPENNIDSKLPKGFYPIKQENSNKPNFSNLGFKPEPSQTSNPEFKPTISNTKNESQSSTSFVNNNQKKSRLSRADSSTVLSYSDTLDNDNCSNSKKFKHLPNNKNNKKPKSKSKNRFSDSDNDSNCEKTESEAGLNDYANHRPDEEDDDYQEESINMKKLKQTKNKKKSSKNNDNDQDTDEYEEESINLKKSRQSKNQNQNQAKKKSTKINEDEDEEENGSEYEHEDEGEEEEVYDEEDDDDDDDQDFNMNSKKNKIIKKSSSRSSNIEKKNSKKSASRPVRQCRNLSGQNLDNKENDNDLEYTEAGKRSKSRPNDKKLIKETSNQASGSSATYSTRSSKRGRKAFYREFSSSEVENNKSSDEDHGSSYKASGRGRKNNLRKKPRFSSSENLNVS